MNAPLTKQPTSSVTYDRISAVIKDPASRVTTDLHLLDKILVEYDSCNGNVLELVEKSAFNAHAVGIYLLRRESLADLRTAALEAQAHRIAQGDDEAGERVADRLRRMGPSAEAVAFGYREVQGMDGFGASPDRLLVEAAMISLTSSPGPDRSAHVSLQEGSVVQWTGPTLTSADRVEEAKAFYAGLSSEARLDAIRAVQETICENIAVSDGSTRDDWIRGMAMLRAIKTQDASGALRTQEVIEEKGQFWPSHPLSVMSKAITEVVREKDIRESGVVKRHSDEHAR